MKPKLSNLLSLINLLKSQLSKKYAGDLVIGDVQRSNRLQTNPLEFKYLLKLFILELEN